MKVFSCHDDVEELLVSSAAAGYLKHHNSFLSCPDIIFSPFFLSPNNIVIKMHV